MGRHVAGGERRQDEAGGDAGEGEGIAGGDAVEQALEEADQPQRAEQPERQAGGDQPQPWRSTRASRLPGRAPTAIRMPNSRTRRLTV